MFKKSFVIKCNVQMKGSERKKLKMDMLRNFPELSMEKLKNIFPSKENVTNVKLVTHSGEKVEVFCRNKLPLLFSYRLKLYPTIYLLWEYADMLPYFTTHSDVLPILQGGAHLMVAGIALETGTVNEYSFGHLNKRDTVFVNLLNNKAAIGVGETVLSSQEMYLSNSTGKAVFMFHVYGDELCKLGDLKPIVVPELGPVTAQYTPKKKAPNASPPPPPAPSPSSSPSASSTTLLPVSSQATDDNSEKTSNANDEQEEDSCSEVNMDALIEYCFVKALTGDLKELKKLPMLISTFYKLHMIPACPEGHQLNVKKSSFKKISKFIDLKVEQGVIKVSNVSNGVQCITHVNYSHRLLCDTDYLKQFKDGQQSVKSTGSTNSASSGAVNNNNNASTNVAASPQVCEKYTVTQAVLPVFEEFLLKKGNSVTPPEARKYITEYIRKKNLCTKNSPLVNLDSVLKNIVHGAANGEEAVDVMPWEKVINAVLYKMGHTYKITNTENADYLRPKEFKGKLPVIDIHVLMKTGNKKVTTVDNLEHYNINITDFVHQCQVAAAASATVNNVAGSKSAQVQIQGNQVNCVKKLLLEHFHIPIKYLRGLEFTDKKKK